MARFSKIRAATLERLPLAVVVTRRTRPSSRRAPEDQAAQAYCMLRRAAAGRGRPPQTGIERRSRSTLAGAALTLGLLLLPLVASAQSVERPIGIGAILGDPFGVTAKIWLDQRNALQANLGWRTSIYGSGEYYYLWDASVPYFSLDWVHHSRWARSRRDTVAMGVHFGVGGGIDWLPGGRDYYYLFGHHYLAGGAVAPALRVPLGFDVEFPRGHVETFAELVPILQIVFGGSPPVYPDLMIDLGFRFYF
jgi:hypothetical protein